MRFAILFVSVFWTVILMFSCGCVGTHHGRKVVTYHPDGSKKSYTRESGSLVTLFKKGEADMLHSETIDKPEGYSRTIGAKKIKTDGDSKTLESLGSAVKKNNPYTLDSISNE